MSARGLCVLLAGVAAADDDEESVLKERAHKQYGNTSFRTPWYRVRWRSAGGTSTTR